MENFKFGIRNYQRTLEKHTPQLIRYREACEKTPGLEYNYAQDHTPEEMADRVMFSRYFGSPNTRKAVCTAVNYFFFQDIREYLRVANLPKSWVAAVYLDCYDELNSYINEVANCIWE